MCIRDRVITVFHSSEIFQRMQAQGLLQSDALLFINSIANVSLTVEDVEEYACLLYTSRCV